MGNKTSRKYVSGRLFGKKNYVVRRRQVGAGPVRDYNNYNFKLKRASDRSYVYPGTTRTAAVKVYFKDYNGNSYNVKPKSSYVFNGVPGGWYV